MTLTSANDKIFGNDALRDMTERRQQILKESIKNFIETGQPITSGRLYKSYDFGIKPAMIRRELSELDDSGFFIQMHTSGGRYPTNKAYQYLVDQILEDKLEAQQKRLKRNLDILHTLREGRQRAATENLANYLEVLSVMYDPSNDAFYNSGLKDLFDHIEFQEKQDIFSIVEDFEMLRHRLDKNRWWSNADRWPQVFIGQSPITESNNLAVIAQKIKSKNNNEILLLAIGPCRMDYRKSINLFKYIQDNINHV